MKQLSYFFNALLFFTRFPIPKFIAINKENLKYGMYYFSLIGLLIGGLSALVFWVFRFILPPEIAVLLSMLFSILATGGLHEDGLADVCDGFGGGWDKSKILAIMKDSTIGVYGAIGLLSVLALKAFALSKIEHSGIIITLICGHTLSRAFATLVMYFLPYVSEVKTSKSKNTGIAHPISMPIVNLLLPLSLLYFYNSYVVYIVLIPCTLVLIHLILKYKKWIGGYTGDCAGAVQQITEVVFYISILALWNYI